MKDAMTLLSFFSSDELESKLLEVWAIPVLTCSYVWKRWNSMCLVNCRSYLFFMKLWKMEQTKWNLLWRKWRVLLVNWKKCSFPQHPKNLCQVLAKVPRKILVALWRVLYWVLPKFFWMSTVDRSLERF